MTDIGAQAGSAIIVSYILEWIKTSPIPVLNQWDGARYKSIIGFLAAAITTLGIHYTYDSSTRDLLVHIPTVWEFLVGAWSLSTQWALQQAAYDGFVRSKPN